MDKLLKIDFTYNEFRKIKIEKLLKKENFKYEDNINSILEFKVKEIYDITF